MTKAVHGNLGDLIGGMVRNTVQGRDLLHGLATSENGFLEQFGHRRVLLNEIAIAGSFVIATTDTWTLYAVEVVSGDPVRTITHSDDGLTAEYVLRRANVSIQRAGGGPKSYKGVLFGYDTGSGTIVVYDGEYRFIRRSSTIRNYLVVS